MHLLRNIYRLSPLQLHLENILFVVSVIHYFNSSLFLTQETFHSTRKMRLAIAFYALAALIGQGLTQSLILSHAYQNIVLDLSATGETKATGYQNTLLGLSTKDKAKATGRHKNGSRNQQWSLTPAGENRLTIQNVRSGEYLAATDSVNGAPLVGTRNPELWAFFFETETYYQIGTVDRQFVINITGSQDGAPAVLAASSYRDLPSQFFFEQVNGQ